jgi:hypothetical protein
MHEALKVLSERLPHVQAEVTRLFESDDVFRELCEEYQSCIDAVAHMQSSKAASESLQREYAALRLRLEGELLRYLTEHGHA